MLHATKKWARLLAAPLFFELFKIGNGVCTEFGHSKTFTWLVYVTFCNAATDQSPVLARRDDGLTLLFQPLDAYAHYIARLKIGRWRHAIANPSRSARVDDVAWIECHELT